MRREEFLEKFNDVDLELLTTKVMIQMLGTPANKNGYHYIRTSIVYCIKNPEIIFSITKDLYPELSKIYRVSTGCIEDGIRHEIESSWERRDKEKSKDIFGLMNQGERPTNTEYIMLVAEYVYSLLTEKEVNK